MNERWAQVIAHFLKPGGTFYIREFHPFAKLFDDSDSATDLKVRYPYLPSPKPMRFESEGSYAYRTASMSHRVTHEWSHSLGEIVTSLALASLTIEFLHEFPYCDYKMLPFMVPTDHGQWRLREVDGDVPLTFSIKARRRDE